MITKESLFDYQMKEFIKRFLDNAGIYENITSEQLERIMFDEKELLGETMLYFLDDFYMSNYDFILKEINKNEKRKFNDC